MNHHAITQAFNHVRQFHPEVSSVRYDEDGRWLFTDSHGDAPTFPKQIDVGILEDAADSLDSFPAYFNFENGTAIKANTREENLREAWLDQRHLHI